jgi:hypothetical protein
MSAARMGEIRNAYKILVGKSEEKMPFEKHVGVDERRTLTCIFTIKDPW